MIDELQELRARLQKLEDINAIKEVQRAYWRSIDTQRPDDLREVFAPDGIHVDFQDMPIWKDREAFIKIFRELGCHPHRREAHFGQNPHIELTATDRARGVWHLQMFAMNYETRTTIQIAGEYQSEYVRQSGRWWVKSMIFRRNSLYSQQINSDGAVAAPDFGTVGGAAAAHLFGPATL
jgi:hypothetical protein